MPNNEANKKDNAVKKLQIAAEKVKEQGYDQKTDIRDIIKNIIFFFFTVAIGFGWMMLMLLIISFVSLGYIHMHFDRMIIVSVVTAILAGIWYISRILKK